MNILIVSQYFWPESFRINELTKSLNDKRVKITILTGKPNYPDGKIFNGYSKFSFDKEKFFECDVIRVPIIPRGKSNSLSLIINYFSFIFSASLFSPILLKNKKFDVIFVYGLSPIFSMIPAIILKKLKNVPLVTWVGDLWPESLESTGHIKNKYLIKLIEKAVKYVYSFNDLILVQSIPFIPRIKKLQPKIPIEYFPNPGENIFNNDINNYKSNFTLKQGFNIVFAGNIGKVQSIKMIIDAAIILQKDPDINIYIFGSGSLSEWANNIIINENLTNIFLPGRFPITDMPSIFKQSDVLLVSLINDEIMNSTVPAKIQSYMAAGKPIIAAMNGEGARLINESNAGISSAAENSIELANSILSLKNLNSDELLNLGNNANLYYKNNFDSNVLADKLINKLNILIKKK
jgi:glycosyltransferase involved in cell wall biosynthesis